VMSSSSPFIRVIASIGGCEVSSGDPVRGELWVTGEE
jgi:hypothetical protein